MEIPAIRKHCPIWELEIVGGAQTYPAELGLTPAELGLTRRSSAIGLPQHRSTYEMKKMYQRRPRSLMSAMP